MNKFLHSLVAGLRSLSLIAFVGAVTLFSLLPVLCAAGNGIDTDTDGDGLTDLDEVQRYLTNPELKDTDGDGYLDGDEIASNTDPNDPMSFFSLKIVSFTTFPLGGGSEFKIQFNAHSERSYVVYWTDDLKATNWQVVEADLPGVDGSIEYVITDPMGFDPMGFYRVGVSERKSSILTRDVWEGVSGYQISDLTSDVNYPTNPTYSTTLKGLSTPSNIGDNYGQRIYGYLNPPVTGDYSFWIAANNQAELRLSTDANPDNAVKIASSLSSEPKEWDAHARNASGVIPMIAGQAYYIEILHKESKGEDHMAVAWATAGMSRRVISANYFSHARPVAPTVADDYYQVRGDTVFNEMALGVLRNDADLDGDVLTAILVDGVKNGVLSLGSDGGFSYTPTAGFTGTDSFVYRANDGTNDSVNTATVTLNVLPNGDSTVVLTDWPYESAGAATLTAVSPLAGHYAVANRESDRVEIRDIRGGLIATIDAAMIQSAAADLDLTGVYGPCSMTFTPSGRLLYLGVCSATGGGDKDAILLYNVNLGTLVVFDRLVIDSNMTGAENYGMAHFKGALYVGSEDSLYKYAAQRNDTGGNPIEVLPVGSPVTGLTLDMAQRSGEIWLPKLYLSTPTDLYRIDPEVPLTLGTSIGSGTAIEGLTFGRSYGGAANGGLYVLDRVGDDVFMKFTPTSEIRAGGNVTLQNYRTCSPDLSDIAATACGRILMAKSQPVLMSDSSDTRLGFDEWMVDEFTQYVNAIRGLIGDGSVYLEGFLARKIIVANSNPSDELIADNVGWAIFLLMAADQVLPDPGIESDIELLIQRHIGEHPDGKGGDRTIDGYYVRQFDINGDPRVDPDIQLYTMMKLLPAVYRAAELYPSNVNIAAYKDIITSHMHRSSDYINGEKRVTWQGDNDGPLDINNGMSNETWLYGEIGAAQDPLARDDYANYVYDREKFDYDPWLTNEPVIKSNHSAFIIMGSSMILRHHFESPGWAAQNKNYVAASLAVGDDLGTPYATAFSAGSTKTSSYHANSPADHPDDIVHFPALVGMGQHDLSPVVGGYLAYRDGRRREFTNADTAVGNVNMLARWSFAYPETYEFHSMGVADFWFGGIGLAESIQPGVIDQLRDDYFLPQPQQSLEAGLVRLDYSKITPRRIMGSNDGVNWTSYGFQMTPFVFEDGDHYTYYDVIDPEGEVLKVPNGDFELGLSGWTQAGDYAHLQTAVAGSSIVGTSAEIRTNANSTTSESSFTQTLDLSMDLENTRYIIRADGSSVFGNPPGQAYLRIEWDADLDPGNGIISTQTSNHLNAANTRVEYRIDGLKPAGANYMHLYLVVEMGESKFARYIFDNVSLIRLGADVPQVNGDFENGNLDGWVVNSSKINLTTASAEVISGTSSIKFRLPSNSNKSWQSMTRTVDLSGDSLGTRSIFRMNARAISMVESDFQINALVYDASGALLVTRLDIGDVTSTTDGEIAFTLRKRSNYDHVVLEFRMKRIAATASTAEEVVLDDFRLDREKIY